MAKRLWAVMLAFGLLSVAAASVARADMRSVEPFYGSYEGEGILIEGFEVSKREMKVTIGPTDAGFNVTWETTTIKKDSDPETKRYSINFTRTGREDIFASQMRVNKFGSRVPLDPLKGDPMIWARVIEDTLTVYAMRITADGSYDLQVYNRVRTEDGLDLAYSRFLEGQPVRTVEGFLKSVER